MMFRAHYATVASYALRRAAPEDAADVVAETFAVAWRRIDAVPTGSATLPWLLVTARHCLANERRRQHRGVALAQQLAGQLERVGVDRMRPVDEDAMVALRAFTDLSDEDRELLRLYGWDGLSVADIATVLEITTNAARVRLHRARTRFSQRLADEGLPCDAFVGPPTIRATTPAARTKGAQDNAH